MLLNHYMFFLPLVSSLSAWCEPRRTQAEYSWKKDWLVSPCFQRDLQMQILLVYKNKSLITTLWTEERKGWPATGKASEELTGLAGRTIKERKCLACSCYTVIYWEVSLFKTYFTHCRWCLTLSISEKLSQKKESSEHLQGIPSIHAGCNFVQFSIRFPWQNPTQTPVKSERFSQNNSSWMLLTWKYILMF